MKLRNPCMRAGITTKNKDSNIQRLLDKVRNKLISCSWKKSLKIKDTKYNLALLLNATLPCLVFLSLCSWELTSLVQLDFWITAQNSPCISLPPSSWLALPFANRTEPCSPVHTEKSSTLSGMVSTQWPISTGENIYVIFNVYLVILKLCSTSLKVRVLSSNCTYLC